MFRFFFSENYQNPSHPRIFWSSERPRKQYYLEICFKVECFKFGFKFNFDLDCRFDFDFDFDFDSILISISNRIKIEIEIENRNGNCFVSNPDMFWIRIVLYSIDRSPSTWRCVLNSNLKQIVLNSNVLKYFRDCLSFRGSFFSDWDFRTPRFASFLVFFLLFLVTFLFCAFFGGGVWLFRSISFSAFCFLQRWTVAAFNDTSNVKSTRPIVFSFDSLDPSIDAFVLHFAHGCKKFMRGRVDALSCRRVASTHRRLHFWWPTVKGDPEWALVLKIEGI